MENKTKNWILSGVIIVLASIAAWLFNAGYDAMIGLLKEVKQEVKIVSGEIGDVKIDVAVLKDRQKKEEERCADLVYRKLSPEISTQNTRIRMFLKKREDMYNDNVTRIDDLEKEMKSLKKECKMK